MQEIKSVKQIPSLKVIINSASQEISVFYGIRRFISEEPSATVAAE
jgi:hypothetical protein